MKLKTKYSICAFILAISAITIVGTVSYAYFTAVSEVTKMDVSLKLGNVNVIFRDEDMGLNAVLDFDQSVTKKFTIENNGVIEASVKMLWNDMVNTYTRGSLTYTLSYSETEDGTFTEVIGKTNVPVSDVAVKKVLASELIIPVGKKYYYHLEVTFNHLSEVNQDADINAVFNSKFELVDISDKIKYKITFDATGGTSSIRDKILIDGEDFVYGDLPTPKRTGYKFLGWYTESAGGEQILNSTSFELNGNQTLYAQWLAVVNVPSAIISSSKGAMTQFSSAAKTDEGVFSMPDTYGTSYYFRGAVENNYIKYGKNKSGQDMWWRIIRVNGDKTLRIQYDGAGPAGENTYTRGFATSSAWNSSRSDAKYMGYMYGPTGTTASTSKTQAQTNTVASTIKTKVDNWYKENIVDTGYSSNVSDNIFCNDRKVEEDPVTGSNGNYTSYKFTTLGYGKNPTLYKAYSRLGYSFTVRKPIFTCPAKNDAFTVNDKTRGNGALTYPVGLITADEVTAAGSMSTSVNNSFYLNKKGNYYTMTPWYFHLSQSGAIMYYVSGSGALYYGEVTSSFYIAPVINLKTTYTSAMRGNGTASDPYREA